MKKQKSSQSSEQLSIKRAFSSSAPSSSQSLQITDSEDTLVFDGETEMASKRSKPDIMHSLRAKSPWDKDGDKTVNINNKIMEMIAVDLQPLSIVENIGFKRLISELQPKYKMPGRYFLQKN
ncbi:hypothetical protein niasHT_018454 [Heterodera trifolii]|uniref:Uncharacterized protein n=1 Tax=Heterodera trifolii TaxID=157864 RepID=A0ABD2KWP3_9BILA